MDHNNANHDLVYLNRIVPRVMGVGYFLKYFVI